MGTNALSGPAINRSWENEKARELIVAPGDDQSSRTRKPDIRQQLSPKDQSSETPVANRAGFIRFGEWLQIGAIKFPHTTIGGLERARKRTRSRRKIVIPSLSL